MHDYPIPSKNCVYMSLKTSASWGGKFEFIFSVNQNDCENVIWIRGLLVFNLTEMLLSFYQKMLLDSFSM